MSISFENEKYFDTKEAATFTHMSVGWFNVKASKGDGIPFIKAGSKRLYKLSDLIAWLETRYVTSTADYAMKKREGTII